MTDIKAFREQIEKCYKIFEGRNKKYGDSWKVLTIPSCANLVEMKMHRIANMDVERLDPKIEDEFVDTINYAIFGLIKLKQKNENIVHNTNEVHRKVSGSGRFHTRPFSPFDVGTKLHYTKRVRKRNSKNRTTNNS